MAGTCLYSYCLATTLLLFNAAETMEGRIGTCAVVIPLAQMFALKETNLKPRKVFGARRFGM